MKIRDIMTTSPHTIQPEEPVQVAAKMMKQAGIGVLPVSKGDKVMGMVTDRDIVVRPVAEGMDPSRTTVESIMTTPIAHVYDDEEIPEAAGRMKEKRIKRLAVLDRNEKLVGMVTLGDLAARAEDETLVASVAGDVLRPSS